MDQRERALLAGLPGTGPLSWNSLWQNAVGDALGRGACVTTEVDRGALTALRAEWSR